MGEQMQNLVDRKNLFLDQLFSDFLLSTTIKVALKIMITRKCLIIAIIFLKLTDAFQLSSHFSSQ